MTATTLTDIPTRDQLAIEDTWDLTTIYATDEAWEAEFATVGDLLEKAVAFRGRIGEGADVAKAGLEAVFAVNLVVSRLAVYASLRRDEDTTDTDAGARYERAVAASIGAGEVLAFFQPEILALPAETLAARIADPALATYRHVLEDLERRRAHVRSEEVEEVLAQFSDVTRSPSEAFGALDNADLSYGTVRDESDQEVTLTKGRYGLFQESRNRDMRRSAHEAMSKAYLDHGYTLASLHGSSVRKDVVAARVRGYDSARHEALFDDNIEETVYDSLLEVVQSSRPVIERYLALRKRALGVDELRRYDLRVPLAPEPARRYEYRDAVRIVLDGVGALGERYTSDLRKGFDSRWVDVHETKGKRSGAYSWGVYGAPPVMLMNWNGTLSDVFTLAHEAGHAMHTFYANASQPFHDAGYPIFLAEIASTVNEVLLTWRLLETEAADDPVARFGLLNRFADGFDGTVTSQAMYADFEKRTHVAVEAGQPLTLELLNDLFGEAVSTYSPGVVVDENVRIGWARVPHFYRAFYVYQYATGLSAAINIATAVRDEGDAARERYLGMLAAGGSDYPIALLKGAGVDLSSPEPIRVAFREFERVVAEMERLEGEGVLDAAMPASSGA
ncbi:MAG: oligoendopeptidase F [Chloroflexia bacterium]|nr:oligoendopeptidase F [Chloroflexia bacterium]